MAPQASFSAADVVRASGEYDPSFVRRLDLSGLARRACLGAVVPQLSNLQVLCLSGHGIASLRPLEGLPQLAMLDVSLNGISDLGAGGCDLPCEALPSLRRLDLRGNHLPEARLRATAELLGRVPRLEYLWLRSAGGDISEDVWEDLVPQGSPCAAARSLGAAAGCARPERTANPMCRAPGYLDALLRSVPALICLDGEDLRLRKACGEDCWTSGEPDAEHARPLPAEPWLPKWRNRWGHIIPTGLLGAPERHDEVRRYGAEGGAAAEEDLASAAEGAAALERLAGEAERLLAASRVGGA